MHSGLQVMKTVPELGDAVPPHGDSGSVRLHAPAFDMLEVGMYKRTPLAVPCPQATWLQSWLCLRQPMSWSSHQGRTRRR